MGLDQRTKQPARLEPRRTPCWSDERRGCEDPGPRAPCGEGHLSHTLKHRNALVVKAAHNRGSALKTFPVLGVIGRPVFHIKLRPPPSASCSGWRPSCRRSRWQDERRTQAGLCHRLAPPRAASKSDLRRATVEPASMGK